MENRRLLIELKNGIPKNQRDLDILKKDFILKDIINKDSLMNGEFPNLDFNKFKIQTKVIIGKSVRIVQDEFGFEEEEIDLELDVIEIDFYEEFERALETLFDNYCTKFLNELDGKGIYSFEGIEGYKLVKLKKLNNLISELDNCCDLEEDVKTLIREFYSKVYDFISNFKMENYQVSKKLKFKLNKNQLIWLFQTMYKKDVISGMSQSDLYRILEDGFMYRYNGKYIDMTGVSRQANKLVNSNTSPEKAIKLLSETFNKDFFSSER